MLKLVKRGRQEEDNKRERCKKRDDFETRRLNRRWTGNREV